MKPIFRTTTLAVITVLSLSWHNQGLAQQTQGQKLVDSIQSVAQVKRQLKELFTNLNQCGTGGCFNMITTNICELVGALDVKLDGKIIGEMSGFSDTKLPISASDLKLMKKIFSQCKPTNYQYWKWETVLHVGYDPTPQIDKEIRAALGAPKPR
ncbi:hypothetical protein PN497_02550 [Sphaerospermopsis kisseleviana CS-549]|uniref:Uncharacterized protein n=2 Tax=Sphaerospermopsis TaxID=752201 RepID=A0A479ZW77_9CYAN|nr:MULTISPECIES: hypothetical protein [Sphaerospermopsis]MBD2132641.1 hypothetical protein [Sphaerospermopsis sp. FACHB-1094]MDB9440265.1 hypothetical protein [Sphaerospermopsis kisseleviana CS-549]BAZ83605.1 hypothetical protein NIES73_48940 [Sphaerospermopsis kisseleviana NIES-73]GCL35773.1 hypothetical protein SR1949_08710 [Sphaerospermopsis reniformis]